MARRVAPTQNTAAPHSMPTSSPAGAVLAPVPGGASGILPAGASRIEGASTKIHFAGVAESAADPGPVPDEVLKVKRYEVVDAPRRGPGEPEGYRVLIGGVLGWIRDGKVVDHTMYDIEGLKQQGVKLRELEG